MDKSIIKRATIDIVRATLLAIVCSMLLVLLVAIIVKYAPVSTRLATALNQIIKVLAIALGCLIGIRSQRGGWLLGLVVGLLFTLISFGIFAAISGQLRFDDITVWDFVLGIATGIVAGILTVNVRTLDRKGHRHHGRRHARA